MPASCSFAYPIKEEDGGGGVVATTPRDDARRHRGGRAPRRPEVPTSDRRTLAHPFVDREIPIVADAILVDPVGTERSKSLRRDFNDFEVGKRHDLPMINLLNPDGTMWERLASSRD